MHAPAALGVGQENVGRVLSIKGDSVTIGGSVEVMASEQPVSVEIDAPRVTIENAQGITVPGDRSTLTIKNSSPNRSSQLVVGPGSSLGAGTVTFASNGGGSLQVEGDVGAEEMQILGRWNVVQVSSLKGKAGHARALAWDFNASGSPLRAESLKTEGTSNISLRG